MPAAYSCTAGRRSPPAGPAERASGGGQGVLSDTGGAAPGRADLLGGGCGERVCLDVDFTPPRSPYPAPGRAGRGEPHGLGEGVRVDRAPCGTAPRIRSRLTTWKTTLFGLLNPESLGSRMCSGVCPPSNRRACCQRASGALGAATGRPWPLEPSPRPTRSWRVGAPGGRTQVVNFEGHAIFPQTSFGRARGGGTVATIRGSRTVLCMTESWIASGPANAAFGWFSCADARLDLGDLELRHLRLLTRTRAEHAAGRRPRGQKPRRAAISSGGRGPSALHRGVHDVIGFDEPRLLESTSWIPAHTSTARTGPPADDPRYGAQPAEQPRRPAAAYPSRGEGWCWRCAARCRSASGLLEALGDRAAGTSWPCRSRRRPCRRRPPRPPGR